MKTVVNKTTGEVLFCTLIEIEILENQTLIDAEATGNFYNFKTKEFYTV